ncbi:MAG: DUF167 domain-containing protein [Candidatus Heimdallarchaeota archaeon]|nr:DUF167 domain-containing protein [Candidatus Heimdallarchaeota archaeon]
MEITKNGEIIFEVKVIPNSPNTAIVLQDQLLSVRVNKPSNQGKANIELIKILSNFFQISKSNICIVKGTKSRNKKISLVGLNDEKKEEIRIKIQQVQMKQ